MQKPPFVIQVPSDRYFLDDHCANCLTPLADDVEALFCSSWCTEIAEAVRYQRGAYRDGRIDNPDVQDAIVVRNAFLLAGGYHALGRALTSSTRLEVKERDSGRCKECGKKGTDIDHISGSSADLENLQLLCPDCHRAKTAKNLTPASAEQRAWLVSLHLSRVMPEVPRLLADDHDDWRRLWQSLKTARKQRLLDEIVTLGISSKGLRHRADMIAARDRWISPVPPGEAAFVDSPLVDWTWKPIDGR